MAKKGETNFHLGMRAKANITKTAKQTTTIEMRFLTKIMGKHSGTESGMTYIEQNRT